MIVELIGVDILHTSFFAVARLLKGATPLLGLKDTVTRV